MSQQRTRSSVDISDVGGSAEPQPDVSVVIKRLLGWVDRVDSASQTGGAPVPAFQTEAGHNIFPEDDELWWLTDINRRAPADEEKVEGDEDGPPSEVEEQQQEVSDDDPESELDVVPPDSTRAHEPVVAWRH